MWRGCSLLGGGGVGLRWVAWCFAGGMQRPAGCAVAWGDAFARRAGGALPPRRLRCSRSPGARAARPYPRPPTRGKLSLQAFARFRARAALRAGCFCARARSHPLVLCWRMQPPACVVLAHAATRRVRAGGALPPRRSRCSRSPRARGCAPLPRTPTRGKLSLQAFARFARVLRFAQVVLCSRTEPPAVFVLAHAATTRPCALSLSFGRVSPRRSAIAPRLP